MDLASIRQQYLAEEPVYQEVVKYVSKQVTCGLRAKGITAQVHGRCKEIHSVLAKVIRRRYSDPLNDMIDMAGVRAVVKYQSDLPSAEEVIEKSFEVLHRDDKANLLGKNKVGYQSIHFDIRIIGDVQDSIVGRTCEIQLRTMCQDLWAEMAHSLSYKSLQPPSSDVDCRLNKLSALLQFVDCQFEALNREVMSMPGQGKRRLLAELEKHFYRLVSATYDRELSLSVLEFLMPLVGETQEDITQVSSFIQDRSSLIEERIRETQEKPERVFVFQPEGLLLFYLLENDPYQLIGVWADHLDVGFLEDVATTWGLSGIALYE